MYLFLELFSLGFAIFVSSRAICSLPLLINKIFILYLDKVEKAYLARQGCKNGDYLCKDV